MTASDYNYETMDTCDGCCTEALGVMYHADDSYGMPTPVLFLCYKCMEGGEDGSKTY